MHGSLQKSERLRGTWVSVVMVGLVGGLVLASGEVQSQPPPLDAVSVSDYSQESDAISYKIGPQDVLQISVWKDEILSREVVVLPDGGISFPLVGEVRAQGRPVKELAQELNERLARFVSDPRVTVVVTQVNSYKIYVIGKVNRSGQFQIGQQTDVMQALSLGGGLTPFAREGSIKVLRRIKGKLMTFPFDYSDVLKGNNLEQNIVLERGDVVMVP